MDCSSFVGRTPVAVPAKSPVTLSLTLSFLGEGVPLLATTGVAAITLFVDLHGWGKCDNGGQGPILELRKSLVVV